MVDTNEVMQVSSPVSKNKANYDNREGDIQAVEEGDGMTLFAFNGFSTKVFKNIPKIKIFYPDCSA
jgi:hypothetical protein